MRYSRIISLAAIAGALLSTSALAHHVHPAPAHPGSWRYDPSHTVYHAPKGNKSGTWSMMANTYPGDFPDTSLQMLDGTVMMHNGCSADWYKLTPDSKGNYQNGTWTKMGSLPSGYTPLYFSSQVLPNGKLIVNGGEYLNCNFAWTTKGAIYDPATNTWTNVPPPSGWSNIGDAQSVIRTDGSYMDANCCTAQEATASISGTTVTWTATGSGKADENDEEGWTQLADGTILTVDANRDLGGSNDYEIYSESTGAWTTPGKVGFSCTDPSTHEIGPGALLPNGLVLQLCGTPHTGTYDTSSGTWAQAADLPNLGDGALSIGDGPAAVLPDGNVLAAVSPGVFANPTHFLEIKTRGPGNIKATQVDEPASASGQSSWESRMLVLPTGQVLWASDVGDVEIYTPKGKPLKSAMPVITGMARALRVGSTNNEIDGIGFNGVSYGAYYGDDVQASTNYPLVRITNTATGDVCYAATHDHASMGISHGQATSTLFDIPASCETGPSKIQVVANGVASAGKKVKLH